MLLAIDIGNTNIVFGLIEDGRILKDWRLRSDPGLTADEIGVFLAAGPADQASRLPHTAGGCLHSDLDLLMLFERQRLRRLEHAVLVDGFDGNRHDVTSRRKDQARPLRSITRHLLLAQADTRSRKRNSR